MSLPAPDSAFNLSAECLQFARTNPDASALCFARLAPDHPAWEPDNRPQSYAPDDFLFETWSFGAAEDRVLAMAAALRAQLDAHSAGQSPTDAAIPPRVLIRLAHGPDFAFAFFAIIAAGAVAVPVSPQLSAAEVAFLISDARPTFVLVFQAGDLPLPDAAVLDAAGCTVLPIAQLQTRPLDSASAAAAGSSRGTAAYASTAPDDPAFLIYTSGTSGRPKGVLHAQRSVLGRRPMRTGWTGLGPGDRLLHAGQLNWTYSLGVGLMDPWVAGATAILYAGPGRPELWLPLLTASRATIFAAVPALYRRILKYTPPAAWAGLDALRHGLSAGESLSVELHARWSALSGRPLYEALGMSEVSTYISSGPATPTRPGLPGKPQPGRRIAVLDPTAASNAIARECSPGETGLLAVHRSDPGLMLGYWQRPEADAAAYCGDWFTGGDLVSAEADGYLRYHGRNDDVMTVSGYRVAPLEIEQALEAHPEVLEAGVREEPRGADLRIIVAYIVLRQAAPDSDAAELKERLQQHLHEHLAAYKRPRELHFRSQLPRTANGKLIRAQL